MTPDKGFFPCTKYGDTRGAPPMAVEVMSSGVEWVLRWLLGYLQIPSVWLKYCSLYATTFS